MQRRVGVMVGAVVLGFAGMLGVGPSAVAAEAVDMGIQPGNLSVYEHDDFKGGSARFTTTNNNLSGKTWDGEPGRFLNDNISSVKNQTNRDVLLYDNSGCTGTSTCQEKIPKTRI